MENLGEKLYSMCVRTVLMVKYGNWLEEYTNMCMCASTTQFRVPELMELIACISMKDNSSHHPNNTCKCFNPVGKNIS